MGLEAVIQEIRTKGQKEADAIREETRKEVNQILASSQEKSERIKVAADESVEKQIRNLENQEMSAANLVVKREVLNSQKELLDQVYKKVLSNLQTLPESFHRDAIKSLLLGAKKQIPQGTVHCNARDLQVLKEVIAQNAEFKEYTAGSAVDIEGGIIVESRDGTLQIDSSYRTFLNQVWETGLKDASDILFS